MSSKLRFLVSYEKQTKPIRCPKKEEDRFGSMVNIVKKKFGLKPDENIAFNVGDEDEKENALINSDESLASALEKIAPGTKKLKLSLVLVTSELESSSKGIAFQFGDKTVMWDEWHEIDGDDEDDDDESALETQFESLLDFVHSSFADKKSMGLKKDDLWFMMQATHEGSDEVLDIEEADDFDMAFSMAMEVGAILHVTITKKELFLQTSDSSDVQSQSETETETKENPNPHNPTTKFASEIVEIGEMIMWKNEMHTIADFTPESNEIVLKSNSKGSTVVISKPLFLSMTQRWSIGSDIEWQSRVWTVLQEFDIGGKKNVVLQDKSQPSVTQMVVKGQIFQDTLSFFAEEEEKSGRVFPTGIEEVSYSETRPQNGRSYRTIMVIGETGCGKTTVINSMMNYLFDVHWDDPGRYKLIVEKFDSGKEKDRTISQTDEVTAYHLEAPKLDFGVTLIDTPGFGDTRGLDQDKKITQSISDFFEKELDDIHAICFVIRAPQGRLTPTQQYIFNQIMSIFGNDIGRNVFILFTFCDAKTPPALSAVKKEQVPFVAHFKLNNSAFFLEDADGDSGGGGDGDDGDDGDDDDEMNELFWKMGMKSFEKLFEKIGQTTPISLRLTKDVLRTRNRLETTIENLQPQITVGLQIMENLRRQIRIIAENEQAIAANKDFTYIDERVVTDRRRTPAGSYTTLCTVCSRTCHERCAYSNSEDKKNCGAMGSNGYCRNCPGKCHWTNHHNSEWIILFKTIKETKTKADLEQRYLTAGSTKSKTEQIMAGSLNEFNKAQLVVYGMIQTVRECVQELGKIALRPLALPEEQQFQNMIESEQTQRKEGWRDRVHALKELKKKSSTLKKVMGGDYQKETEALIQDLKKTKPGQSTSKSNCLIM